MFVYIGGNLLVQLFKHIHGLGRDILDNSLDFGHSVLVWISVYYSNAHLESTLPGILLEPFGGSLVRFFHGLISFYLAIWKHDKPVPIHVGDYSGSLICYILFHALRLAYIVEHVKDYYLLDFFSS